MNAVMFLSGEVSGTPVSSSRKPHGHLSSPPHVKGLLASRSLVTVYFFRSHLYTAPEYSKVMDFRSSAITRFLIGRSEALTVSRVIFARASASFTASNAFLLVFFRASARIKSFPAGDLSSKISILVLPTQACLMSLCHTFPVSCLPTFSALS